MSVLSLLLCFAMLGLWFLSLSRRNELTFRARGEIAVESNCGTIGLSWVRRYELSPNYTLRASENFATDSTGRLLALHNQPFIQYSGSDWGVSESSPEGFRDVTPTFGRFGYDHFDGVDGNYFGATDWTIAHTIAAPHWFLVLFFAILPAFHLRAILRSRRRNRVGLCPRCGYDLRATPERCPECGAVNDEIRNQKSESNPNDEIRNPERV